MKPRNLAALAVALTLAGAMFAPIATSVTDNTGTQAINETVTANPGTYQELDGYQITDGSYNVTYDNGTQYVSATEGSDYELAQENGSIKFLSSGNVADGDQAYVHYQYEATSGVTTTLVNLFPMFLGLLLIGTIAGKLSDSL